jgi:ADP-ribosyl-[dinitrogen reductase] hydrolase
VGEKLEEALKLAKESAMATHNHPEGVKGAQATAAAIYMARTGSTKEQIKQFVEKSFGYYLDESVDSIRVWYRYDVSCQGTCPQAIRCFLESNDFEHAIRLAVSIGGDTDTIACITGSIAEAMYGIPAFIEQQALRRLPADLKEVVDQFYQRIGR